MDKLLLKIFWYKRKAQSVRLSITVNDYRLSAFSRGMRDSVDKAVIDQPLTANCKPPTIKNAQELFQNSIQKSLAPPRFFPD
jgi:hypothetical protein